MNGHVTAWLEAYHDGELQGRRLKQVETHLAECETCCRALYNLQALSSLLEAYPEPEHLTSPERFAARVGLHLPRRQRPIWQHALIMGWKMAPIGLLGFWIFIQTAFMTSGLITAVLELGTGNELFVMFLPGVESRTMMNAFFGLQGASSVDILLTVLDVLLSGADLLGWNLSIYLCLLITIGLLYASWLASWWVYRQHYAQESLPGSQTILSHE